MQELEKILEEIDAHAIEFEAFGVSDEYISINWVKDIIRKHMNDGWIPVEEQLPEERNLYLATAESAGFYFRLIGHWNAPGWTEETGQQKIIAWRPLPEPYQAERSEGRMTDADREIKRLISYIRSCRESNIDCTVTIDKRLTHCVLNALEEVQQYREIGTVEECREAREKL